MTVVLRERVKSVAVLAGVGALGISTFLLYWNFDRVKEASLKRSLSWLISRKGQMDVSIEGIKWSPGGGTYFLHGISLNRSAQQAGPHWSAYRLKIERAECTLDVWKWLRFVFWAKYDTGKGENEESSFLRNCSVQGLRGTIDRRHIRLTNTDGGKRDVEEMRRHASALPFDIQGLQVRDALVQVLSGDATGSRSKTDIDSRQQQNDDQDAFFRPFSVSILAAKFGRLRWDWLWVDVMSAESIVGIYDRSLFSLHDHQQNNQKADEKEKVNADNSSGLHLPAEGPKKWRHFKIDGLKVDQVSSGPAYPADPLNWLDRGAIDADIYFLLEDQDAHDKSYDLSTMRMRMDLSFRDLHATPPSSASLLSSTLVTPLAAYLNSTRPCIKVKADFETPLGKMRYGWSALDTGMADDIHRAVSAALTAKALAPKEGTRFGLWGLSRLLAWPFFPEIHSASSGSSDVWW